MVHTHAIPRWRSIKPVDLLFVVVPPLSVVDDYRIERLRQEGTGYDFVDRLSPDVELDGRIGEELQGCNPGAYHDVVAWVVDMVRWSWVEGQ